MTKKTAANADPRRAEERIVAKKETTKKGRQRDEGAP